jgi:hypothetical protein
MVDKYRDLISDFVGDRLSAQDFESKYLQIFKTDADQVPSQEFNVLEQLFFAIDDYVADPELRAKVGGLDERDLRDHAAAAYSRLYGS